MMSSIKKSLVEDTSIIVMLTIASLIISFVLIAQMEIESFTCFVFDIVSILVQVSLVRLWYVTAEEELKQEEARKKVEFRMIVRSARHD